MPNLKIRTKALPYLVLILLAPLGCGSNNPYFEDDEGGPHQNSSSGAHPDSLSLPYVTGTKVRIAVKSSGSTNTTAWQVRSDNPAVLSVDKLSASDDFIVADCTAQTVGEVMLRAFDEGGSEQRAAQISIGNADRVRVLSHGRLRVLGATAAAADSAEVQEARVLSGSTGVFGVLYYRGTERLYGRGIIETDAVTQLTVQNQTSSGAANNEWLFIKPASSGSFMLNLRRGTTTFRSLPVVSVAESELRTLNLAAEQPDSPAADQQIWVLAQATDAASRNVEGVYVGFTLAGTPQIGNSGNAQVTTGDLYRYSYASGAMMQLVGTRGALTASLSIPASKGYVANTTYLGCNMTPGSRAPIGTGAFFGALLMSALLSLGMLRRRARAI